MTREVYVYLTGGLGNQLFQLTSALNSLGGAPGKVFLVINLGSQRMTKGKVDILYLNLPENVISINRPTSQFVRKVAGYLLRSGLTPQKWESNRIVKFTIRAVGQLVFSIRYRRILHLQVADNVGRFDIKPRKRTFIIGYFQTFHAIENFGRDKLTNIMSPVSVSNEVKELISQALAEQPIFLHIRLTDYLLETQFGNLGTEYYRESLKYLGSTDRSIWVFSDDLESARKLLPKEYQHNYFYVDIKESSPAELLFLLRHGFDYVIANSTFSWWGASTSTRFEAKIVAPNPWFARMEEPTELIPSDWIRKRVLY